MLYDKRWDAKTKTDPLSLDSLIAWLEKQPADAKYCYSDTGACLLAQYFAAIGFEGILVGARDFDHNGIYNIPLPRHFNRIAGAWIPRHASLPAADLECAEAAYLYVVLILKCFLDRVQERVDHSRAIFLGNHGARRSRDGGGDLFY